VIEADPSPTSVEVAIAASARRARMLAGMQSIALIAIVIVGSRAGCGESAAHTDAGISDAASTADALVAFATDAADDAAARACTNAADCRAACEGGGEQRAEACVRWADMLRTGSGGAKRDRLAARDRYRSACRELTDALACTRLALEAGLLRDLDLAPDWLEPAQAPLGLLGAACAGDHERGKLACAALELLVPMSAIARERRVELCGGEDVDRAGCAAAIALSACRADDAAACYLAARDQQPTRTEAAEQLRKLCDEKQDRPACLYRYYLSPPGQRDQRSLLAACSTFEDESNAPIARACLEYALMEPFRATPAERACELGSCQHPGLRRAPTLAVLKKSCDGGHVNGCANLIFAQRGNPAAWRPIVEDIERRMPAYASKASTAMPVEVVACHLGSFEGCSAAIKRIGAIDRAHAARLAEFSQRLLDPLAVN
jgi:hypothetical protein